MADEVLHYTFTGEHAFAQGNKFIELVKNRDFVEKVHRRGMTATIRVILKAGQDHRECATILLTKYNLTDKWRPGRS